MINRKYYYSKLTPVLRDVLNTIIKKLKDNESVITIINPKVTSEQIGMLFKIIDKDFPEIFYIDMKTIPIKIVEYGSVKKISVNYLYGKKDVVHIQNEIRDVTDRILLSISKYSSIQEREKYVHDYLADKVIYQHNSRNPIDYSIVGPLLHGHAICEGYAKAFKYLCEQSQLNCLIVSGKAKNSRTGIIENHAWNILYIGSKSYAHVDVTWDSGKSYGINTLYSYFNLPDELIESDHFWNRASVPVCIGKHSDIIITIKSALELADFIAMKVSNGEKSIDFLLNKRFNSTDDLVSLISKILKNKNLIMVKSFKVVYNKNTFHVHCDFIM